MLNQLSKPVNIRVSEEELRELHESGEKMCTRKVSDLGQRALRMIVEKQRSAQDNSLDAMASLDELSARLAYLQLEVASLKAWLNPSAAKR